MRYAVSTALASLFLATLPVQARAQTAHAAARSTAEIARIAAPATATIIAIGAHGDTLALGSGFLVRSDGVLITNWHVLTGASRAVVALGNGERYERVSVLDGDPKLDVVLLKVPGYALPTLRVRSDVPAVGERIVTVGSPLGLSQTVSEGIVSATRMIDGRQLVQITAPISHGSSGGPVLDDAGRVFAISTLYLDGGQQLNFAVPVRYAMGLLLDHPDEHTIAATFAPASSTGTHAGTPAAMPATPATPAVPDAPPPRARLPRPVLSGTFFIRQTWYGGSVNGSTAMGLLIPSSGSGWITVGLRMGDSTLKHQMVFRVRSFRTNVGGDVVLDDGGVIFDGYQIEGGGFYVRGQLRENDGTENTITIRGTPHAIPLSNTTGLYTATVRTRYYAGGEAGSFFDWNGDMAVAAANDSIWVAMTLTNANGGSTGLLASGPLGADGSFDLFEPLPDVGDSRLTGTVRAGVITAQWLDMRNDGGHFEGTLVATRQ